MAETPFQIKDFETLTSSLLNYIYFSDNQLSDFNVGSVMRSLLEAVASEEEEMYFRLWQGIQNGIQESILHAFNFTPQDGIAATGSVKFGRETPPLENITIPQGTVLKNASGISYKTTAQGLLTTDNSSMYVTVPIIATVAGESGNLSDIGALLQMTNPIAGISYVETATALTGGTDQESKTSVLLRFTNYINSLVRATNNSIEYAATLAILTDSSTGNITEQVKYTKVSDTSTNMGFVDVYIDNGTGTASNNLIAKAQKIIDGYVDDDGTMIDGYKAAGTVATVYAVIPITINIIVCVVHDGDFDTIENDITVAIQDYFSSIEIGDPCIKNALIAAIKSANDDIVDINLTLPAANVTVPISRRCVLGSILINDGC